MARSADRNAAVRRASWRPPPPAARIGDGAAIEREQTEERAHAVGFDPRAAREFSHIARRARAQRIEDPGRVVGPVRRDALSPCRGIPADELPHIIGAGDAAAVVVAQDPVASRGRGRGHRPRHGTERPSERGCMPRRVERARAPPRLDDDRRIREGGDQPVPLAESSL